MTNNTDYLPVMSYSLVTYLSLNGFKVSVDKVAKSFKVLITEEELNRQAEKYKQSEFYEFCKFAKHLKNFSKTCAPA